MSAVVGAQGMVTSSGHLGGSDSWTSIQCKVSGQRPGGQQPGLGEDDNKTIYIYIYIVLLT